MASRDTVGNWAQGAWLLESQLVPHLPPSQFGGSENTMCGVGGRKGQLGTALLMGFTSEQCFTWEALVPWPPGHGKMRGPGSPRPCISHRLPDAATLGPHSAALGAWAPDSPGGEFLGPTQTYSISALGLRPPGCVSWPPGSPAAGSGLKAALDPWLSAPPSPGRLKPSRAALCTRAENLTSCTGHSFQRCELSTGLWSACLENTGVR